MKTLKNKARRVVEPLSTLIKITDVSRAYPSFAKSRNKGALTSYAKEKGLSVYVVKPSLIFDANYIGEIIPEGFDAVRLVLKATVTSSLLWEKEREVARTYIKKGFKIFWEIVETNGY